MRNLQEQVKKVFCYPKLLWPFTVWINCSSDLKNFANSRPIALNFKSFSQSLDHFFLTVGQDNFGNKIPFLFIVRKKNSGKYLQYYSFALLWGRLHSRKSYKNDISLCSVLKAFYYYFWKSSFKNVFNKNKQNQILWAWTFFIYRDKKKQDILFH